MPPRHRVLHEAIRQSRLVAVELGRELRVARIAAGMTQRQVGRAIGTSGSRISRVEHGLIPGVGLEAAARHAAAVGLRLYVRSYPAGRRLLDAPQLELLERLRARVSGAWRWQTEVPMPIDGDLRAADATLAIPGCLVVVEALTRFSDFQAQTRAALAKKRDLRADRLVLVVSATRANRRALAEAGEVARTSFPLTSKAVLRALAEGADPAADGIVLV